jgi:MFS family permease
MARIKRRITSGYSALAIGCALASIPIAFVDVYFLQLAVAILADASDVLGEILSGVVAFFLAVVALVLAGFAGRFFDEHEAHSRRICAVLLAAWLILGLAFFSVRMTNGILFTQGDSPEQTIEILIAVTFLIVFFVDGLLGFLAGKELLNTHLHDYRHAKKEVEALSKRCVEGITSVENCLSKTKQIELQKKALLLSMKTINDTYFSEIVPSRMESLERKMRTQDLLYGSAELLYRRIGYDYSTRMPTHRANRKLIDDSESWR